MNTFVHLNHLYYIKYSIKSNKKNFKKVFSAHCCLQSSSHFPYGPLSLLIALNCVVPLNLTSPVFKTRPTTCALWGNITTYLYKVNISISSQVRALNISREINQKRTEKCIPKVPTPCTPLSLLSFNSCFSPSASRWSRGSHSKRRSFWSRGLKEGDPRKRKIFGRIGKKVAKKMNH